MVKKLIACLLSATILLTGCGSNKELANSGVVNGTQTVDEVLDNNTSGGSGIANNANAVSDLINRGYDSGVKKLEESTYTNVDVDLTTMNSTMIYSQVSNIMSNVDSYVDKVIKMTGYTSIFEDAASGTRYYSCIIPDATACCAQGIEYVLNDDYDKYDSYPVDGEEVTVVGRLVTYEENGLWYLTLNDAEVLV